MKFPDFFFLIVCSVMGLSCSSTTTDVSERRYQRLEVGNDGVGAVSHPKIIYGELTIPAGTNLSEIPSVHRSIASESRVVLIPDVAVVSWTSSDGKSHLQTVPIRSSIKDHQKFFGFKFYFCDDRLDVYLLTRVPKKEKYLDLKEEKIFSRSD